MIRIGTRRINIPYLGAITHAQTEAWGNFCLNARQSRYAAAMSKAIMMCVMVIPSPLSAPERCRGMGDLNAFHH